ncbi:IspD/TarI family cytidylyltransferase [Parasphaerochaeta coccoides]|uniref:4-diphosphocytidyl-2C-methyl-D-erythritol synthase n=1 Tax=Parasphaerochaeta coccoides (strain ATCC BAA-1237 / DSM 17374 / SPN1) TaxID=760011 RepID=F4GJQ4_PARC1|nr:IspD/TarI family cytidylyltransferase [Parasphaerochaeta coccoides]AEC02801.1 4-diphosphocytidyl-2C-methyl-D-erythritol synthase [Parasphaerochaeta coccoides DSM 17374]
MAFPPHAVVVTAAGTSDRFSISNDETLSVKKEFLTIDGKTVLYRAVSPFMEVPGCRLLIVTYPEGMEADVAYALDDIMNQNRIPLFLVTGGRTRQSSVQCALERIASLDIPIEYVAIHDGARPYVTPQLVINTLAMASVFGGAAPVIPVNDALTEVDENGLMRNHIPRAMTRAIQTPQIFRFTEILEAHRQAARSGHYSYVDDTEIYQAHGGHVCASEGDRANRKITWPEDIPDYAAQVAAYREARDKGRKQMKALRDFEALRTQTRMEIIAHQRNAEIHGENGEDNELQDR